VNRSRNQNDDGVGDVMWLENLELNRLLGGKAMTETMWRCDQVRAGRLYNRMMFDTREEAEQFVQRMQKMEPDQMFSIEAIEAKQVWNLVSQITGTWVATVVLVFTSAVAIVRFACTECAVYAGRK
jgi:hypothetical protein